LESPAVISIQFSFSRLYIFAIICQRK
jgi:hypothetical protein